MKSKYVPAIDALRVLAILMVIAIHTTSKTLGAANNDVLGMPLTMFFNQITRGAVALFILISGFVLEGSYDGNVKEFYKKRAGRILGPYLFWSLIYYFFIYAPNPTNFFLVLLIGGAAYQLYFIPSLLILYLLFPLLRKVSQSNLILLSIIEVGLLYWDYSIQSLQSWGPISIVLLNYLIFILGIIGARNQEKILELVERNKIYFGIMSALSLIYVWLEGLGGYLSTGNYLMFYSQRRISILISTVVLAVTLFGFLNKKMIFKKMAELAFFVFFIHLIFLEYVWKYLPITRETNYGLVLFLLVSGLSFGTAAIAHRVKFLSRIWG